MSNPKIVSSNRGCEALKRQGGKWTMRLGICFLFMLLLLTCQTAGGEVSIVFESPQKGETFVAGDSIHLSVKLKQDQKWLSSSPDVFVTAVIRFPEGGTEEILRLRDDGKLGDSAEGDGVWSGIFEKAKDPGIYLVKIKVWEKGKVFWSEGTGFSVKSRMAIPIYLFVLGILIVGAGIVLIWRRRKVVQLADAPLVERAPFPKEGEQIRALRDECSRLRKDMENAGVQGMEDQKTSTFKSLERLLVQLPSVRKAVEEGREIPARDILGLLSPLDQTVSDMGIQPIGEVGGIVEFDPQIHLPAGNFSFNKGQKVRIKFVGYRDKKGVLSKAQVASAE